MKLFFATLDPRFIVPFTPEPEEDDTVDIVKQLNNEIGGGNLDEFSGDYSMNVIYISSGVIGCLLIAVVALLLGNNSYFSIQIIDSIDEQLCGYFNSYLF